MGNVAGAVICGAGIAGAAAAYFLSARHGLRDVVIVEQDSPLSLTSDKSTECYRNWWPGPGSTMVDFSNRSIDLLEELTERTGDRFNMNRRGYAFATARDSQVEALRTAALESTRLGSGPLREHHGTASGPDYVAHRASGYQGMPTGTDLLLDPGLISQHFPGLSPDTRAVLHVRRCGWLRAQQLGTYFLEEARANGARLVRGKLCDITQAGGAVTGVEVESAAGTERIATPRVVLSPGPYLNEALALLDLSLPVTCECHVKVSLRDTHHAMPGDAPLLLWTDPVSLPWDEEEREALAGDADSRYLLDEFPAGVHGRPEGKPGEHYALMLWTYETQSMAPSFPIEWDPHLPEVIVRGMSAMLPGMRAYFDPLPRIPVDGGYYTKTPENRPLVGPLPITGAFVNAAYSGYGIMTAAAGGELLAAHVMETPLPSYAEALAPARFDDSAYLDAFGDAATAGQM
jgi:glycine/D-amino acid oxidase-like deaminating enzyme